MNRQLAQHSRTPWYRPACLVAAACVVAAIAGCQHDEGAGPPPPVATTQPAPVAAASPATGAVPGGSGAELPSIFRTADLTPVVRRMLEAALAT